MSRPLKNQPSIFLSRKINPSLHILCFRRINNIRWKLLQITLIHLARQTRIILPNGLHNADGISGVKIGDAVLGCNVGAGSVVED
jgi:hypothetical protein